MSLKKLLLPILFVWIAWANCVAAADATMPKKEPTPADRTYYFQHRLLPKWTHETGGAFFEDVMRGGTQRIKEAATEIVSAEFANSISVTPLPDKSAVLISFDTPVEMPACYHVLVVKRGRKFQFITLEMSEDIRRDGTLTALCEWKSDGAHGNRGPRKYTDSATFIKEVLGESKSAK